MNNSCFVIMPIGDQTINGATVTAADLKKKYDFIIKEAVQKAAPDLSVIRADEELNPNSISNDIFLKLMHSTYVIADITYPNPNVFYELGIRHAISPRTILIREKSAQSIPFDISHLRYIEYTQDPDGMHNLAEQLKLRFDFYAKNPDKPDNQFLELCSFTSFTPSVYEHSAPTNQEALGDLLMLLINNPNLFATITDESLSEGEQQLKFIQELGKDPDASKKLISILVSSGMLK